MTVFQVIADDADNLEIIAKKFDVDVPILQACLDEAGLNMGKLSKNVLYHII